MPRTIILAQPLLNGVSLPGFRLAGLDGQFVTLSDLRGAKGTVVSFVHGTWCPYCVRQITRLNQITPQLYQRNVGIVCITQDSPESLSAFQHSAQPPLRYPLLADSTPSLSHDFGIFDPDHNSPYVAVFYAGADDRIQYSDVSSDPDCYPNLIRMIEVIDYGPLGEAPIF
jgi:peroxiredoxin